MKVAVFIALRYLFARKSHHAVDIISIVSMVGVALGTVALVIVLSVFNGLEELATSLYSTFDPDLKITAAQGKTFRTDSALIVRIQADPDVIACSQTLEENVLVRYDKQQEIAVLKGVDAAYNRVTGIDTMMIDGKYALQAGDNPQAIVGATLAGKLRIGLHFITPIRLYVVRNRATVPTPEAAMNQMYIFPSGVFAIDEEINAQYLLAPLDFVRTLLENDTITGAIEVNLRPGAATDKAQERITAICGPSFQVKNAYQQNELYYRILKYEKWVGFMILAFVLLIASFNVVGSVLMLMIEKKSDMGILQSMGADRSMIRRIFILQGWMIVLAGVTAGMLIGAALCWLQQATGFIAFSNSGTFVVDAYPVAMRWGDFGMILLATVSITVLTIYFPVRYFIGKYL